MTAAARRRRVLAGAVVLAVAGRAFAAAPPVAIAPRDRMVVLISLDGFPAAAFRDPLLPIPHLRRLATEGAAAQGMTVVDPAVTWANHTSLVTGVAPRRHGVLFNGLLLRDGAAGALRYEHRNRAELVRVPTVQDVASRAGLTTANVDWVPHQVGGTMSWAFPEVPDPQGALEREMVGLGLLDEKAVREFGRANIVWRDAVWTRAAVHLVQRHRPNLLLVHLLGTDSTHHRYGPGSLAGTTALAYADSRVGEILAAIEAAGLGKRATVLVVADHGFKAYRRAIRPNVALQRAGLQQREGEKVTCAAFAVAQGGQAQVYVTDPTQRATLVPKLRAQFEGQEGVARVFEAREFAALGMPTPDENAQAGDLLLVAKDGYAFLPALEGDVVSDVPEGGTPGAHGYLSSDPDMEALFLAWGYGIRSGAPLGRVRTLDVAPTIAALLGLTLGEVDGRAMEGLLDLPRPAVAAR